MGKELGEFVIHIYIYIYVALSRLVVFGGYLACVYNIAGALE